MTQTTTCNWMAPKVTKCRRVAGCGTSGVVGCEPKQLDGPGHPAFPKSSGVGQLWRFAGWPAVRRLRTTKRLKQKGVGSPTPRRHAMPPAAQLARDNFFVSSYPKQGRKGRLQPLVLPSLHLYLAWCGGRHTPSLASSPLLATSLVV